MKFGRSAAFVLSGVMLAISGVGAQEAGDPAMRDADALLHAGKPADAYTLLEPLEFARAGEVRFDYLLGIAALDSGKPDKATLAFERVLAVDPNFAGARLDLARAYYQLGDLPRAKTEFSLVLSQSPPTQARATVEKYLQAIADYESAQQTRVNGYAEVTLGHDSNVNAATSAQQWAGYNLDPNSRQSPDSYSGVNAGVRISHRIATQWTMLGNVDLRQRFNSVLTQFDSGAIDASLGAAYSLDKNSLKLSLTTAYTDSAKTQHRSTNGVTGEWSHSASPENQLNMFLQYGQSRADGFAATAPATNANTEGNTDQSVVGVGWIHALDHPGSAIFSSVYSGEEKSVGGRVDGNKAFFGLRVGAQASLSEPLSASIGLGWQNAKYDKINPQLLTARKETVFDFSAGLSWQLNKLWAMKPQIAYSVRNSNGEAYEYERTDISVTLRRDFQ